MFEYLTAQAHINSIIEGLGKVGEEMPDQAGVMPKLAIRRLVDDLRKLRDDVVLPLAKAEEERRQRPVGPVQSASAATNNPDTTKGEKRKGAKK